MLSSGQNILGAAFRQLRRSDFLPSRLMPPGKKGIRSLIMDFMIYTAVMTGCTLIGLLFRWLGFSDAIASVVCGILFSYLRSRFCIGDNSVKSQNFDSFWETLDVLLNSLLYVMLGLSFVHILQMEHVVILSLIAIAANDLCPSLTALKIAVRSAQTVGV